MSDYNEAIEVAGLRPDYLEMMQAHVDEGGQLSHRNGVDLLREVQRLLALRRPDDAGDDGWRTMESAPKDGAPIWVCNRLYTENGFLPLAVRWRTYHPNAKGEACWRDVHGHKIENITHWRPLPAPPRQLNAGGR